MDKLKHKTHENECFTKNNDLTVLNK